MKRITALLCWNLLFLFSARAAEMTVGIVADRFDGAFERDRAELVSELEQLVSPPMHIRFPERKQIDGKGDPARIERGLARLRRDAGVDMIVALGPLAGPTVLAEGAAGKPTVVPELENAWLFGLSPSQKESGIRNVNYVIGNIGFDAALKRYLEIVPFEHAALLVDARTLALPAARPEAVVEKAKALGVRLGVVPVGPDGTAAVPKGVQAVLLADLSGIGKGGLDHLMARLRAQHIPLFSLGSVPAPGSGVLAVLRIPDEHSRNLRRSALNMLAVLRGAPARSQPVSNEAPATLTVDMAVARTLKVSPPFRVLAQARLLHKTAEKGAALGLNDVAEEALKNNLAVIAGKLGVKEGQTVVSEVRSVLFPQIGADLSYTQLNSDNVYVESGFYAEKSTEGAVKLQQLLFSEKALARLSVQQHLQKSREAQQRRLELEVVRQATTAFLHTLIARTLLDIRLENERLMQANLAMARERVAAGMTDLSDVYYWESEIAVTRQARLAAEAELAKAFETLNRILHRPVTARYALRDATLEDPVLLISDRALLERISNERAFERLGAFYVAEAEKISPNLDEIDARLQAQRRQLRSDQRAYWSPDVVLYGQVSHVFDEQRVPGATFSLEDETNWQAGVTLSLPLFEGGAKNARSTRSRLAVQRLETDRIDRTDALERRIRGDLHTLRAGYPAIALAKAAAKAARKSYALVRENYAQGNRSLADLLLAQNTALSADFGAVNTRYRFLIDLMQLEYDTGRFDFFMSENDRTDFIQRLNHALAEGNGQMNEDRKGTP
jgi:outer membrane protein